LHRNSERVDVVEVRPWRYKDCELPHRQKEWIPKYRSGEKGGEAASSTFWASWDQRPRVRNPRNATSNQEDGMLVTALGGESRGQTLKRRRFTIPCLVLDAAPKGGGRSSTQPSLSTMRRESRCATRTPILPETAEIFSGARPPGL
jgi:hypothetical protein